MSARFSCNAAGIVILLAFGFEIGLAFSLLCDGHLYGACLVLMLSAVILHQAERHIWREGD